MSAAELPPSPIERPRLSDTVYGQLLQDIMAGGLAPGDRLATELQLAQRFSVSRPVVREALQRLQTDGVVISRQGSGTYVQRSPSQRVAELTSEYSLHEVLQCLELRLALEELSARLAARNRTEDQLRSIEQTRLALHQVFGQGPQAKEADYAFHRAIAVGSGNPMLVEALDQLADRVKGGMNVTLSLTREASDQRRARVLDEHDRIVHAIRIGDADSAGIAMRYHLDQARNRLLDRHLDR
ncbi:FadR/GntR family transcriptional regulator [uncultured Ramlibacter sp.]|uniref:FadR/GntR family transcriptional regulator n=1 Tax=uncultured Ramlibacter sp. TaxID=260755 RepID=UPI002629C833|nr:FadR/GntR family transcriptional regulator [uncultured Ramlibacter sp.]